MIKIEETETYGWEAAIRGMRNPKNSWDKSDSKQVSDMLMDEQTYVPAHFEIGPNDSDLMNRLCGAGSDRVDNWGPNVRLNFHSRNRQIC